MARRGTIESSHRAQHDLCMPVVLASPSSVEAVPEEEGMVSSGVGRPGAEHPFLGPIQKLAQLLLAEGQGIMMLEQDQPMARLAVLEQVGGCDNMLRLYPALHPDAQGVNGHAGLDSNRLPAQRPIKHFKTVCPTAWPSFPTPCQLTGQSSIFQTVRPKALQLLRTKGLPAHGLDD